MRGLNQPPSAPAAPVLGSLLAAYASLFLLGFTENARPPLFGDILRDLDLSDGAGGMFFAATSAGVVVGSLSFRWVVRRWSVVRGLQGSLLVSAGICPLLGAAPNLAALVAAAAVFGVAFGGLGLCQNLMVERASPLRLRRRLLTGLHSTYALASLLAPLAVTLLARGGLDWRWTLGLLGAPLLCLALATLPLRPLPRPVPTGEGSSLRGRRGRVLLVAFMVGCCVTAELLASTRLPLLFEREGHGEETAALGLTAFFLCLLVSRVGFSVLSLRIGNRALLAGSAGSALVLFALGLWVEPWLLPLTAFCMGPFFPTAVDLLAHEVPDALDAALGYLFACISTLLVLAHTGVGFLSDAVGLRAAMSLAPLALCGSLVALALLGRGRDEAASDPSA